MDHSLIITCRVVMPRFMLYVVGLVGLVVALNGAQGKSVNVQRTPTTKNWAQDWWKTAVFYQVYPRSFMDADNDGTGDLRGIIDRLQHIVELRVTALWLSPIFKSPMKDHGYDISDFREVDPVFGAMADFEELVSKAHNLGLKVILDYVPNHSSDEHEWFIKSAQGDADYLDYYVWRDGANGDDVTPPNNWISHFHGPSWTYHPVRRQWYLHQFHSGQPDLNFRNPRVVQEMKDVLVFWMDKGVDGFRVDTIPSLFEDAAFPDEELTGDPGCTPNDRCYVGNKYQADQPETFEMVYEWRRLLDDYVREHGGDARVMMTESYSPLEKLVLYYGSADGKHPGAHFSFNFLFITDVNAGSDAHRIVEVIERWTNATKGFVSNWVLGNHDQHRLASRYGVDRSDGMQMLQMILPGVAVTYNGEEIAMENGEVTWEQGQDPQACNDLEENFAKNSRDFERTPMHWDGGVNAGFNTGHETWLPVSEKHLTSNVELQKTLERSHYHLYRNMTLWRGSEALSEGDLKVEALNDRVVQVIRSKNIDNKMFLLNIGSETEILDVSGGSGEFLLVVAASSNSKKTAGDVLYRNEVVLDPYEAVLVFIWFN